MPMKYAPKDGTAIDIWVEPTPRVSESGVIVYGDGRRIADSWWGRSDEGFDAKEPQEWLDLYNRDLPCGIDGDPVAWMYPRRMR